MWKTATVYDRERALRSASLTLRSLLEGANFRTPIQLKVASSPKKLCTLCQAVTNALLVEFTLQKQRNRVHVL
eukprot:3031891-Amphidinium_carterae.1